MLEYGKDPPINGKIEVEVVFDKERDRYLVIDLGWDRDCRVYNCFMHLDIKEGKIWIQRNQTDTSIAEELVQRRRSRASSAARSHCPIFLGLM
ncbi:MAG: XisI protein [Hydrococcus sp. RM1_1_31]|nr:XisI protein [Hydrococcus sp. RM1_1_31]